MNFKDKLVNKLLKIGKKHRILVYPMLALVAVITAISHFVRWSRGNGKKLVASILVVALLITQSLFLTSSADTPAVPNDAVASSTDANQVDLDNSSDEEVVDEEVQVPQFLDIGGDDPEAQAPESNQVKVHYNVYYNTTTQQTISGFDRIVDLDSESSSFKLPNLTNDVILQNFFGQYYVAGFFRVDGIYDNGKALIQNPDSFTISSEYAGQEYNVYVMITRIGYKVKYVDGDNSTSGGSFATADANQIYPVNNPQTGDIDAKGCVITIPSTASSDYPFYKYGYKYASINGYLASSYNSITVNDAISWQTNTITLTVGWTPIQNLMLTYKICDDNMAGTLNVKEDAPAISATEFAYGTNVNISGLAADESDYINNPAYCFTGWKIEGGDSNDVEVQPNTSIKATLDNTPKIVQTNGDISGENNVKGVTLVGQWEKRTLKVCLQDGTQVSENQSSPTLISGEFETDLACELTIQYNGNNMAVDNCKVTTEGTTPTGLIYEKISNTIRIHGKPETVTTGTTYTLEVKDETNNIIQKFYLEFVINPKTVKLSTLTSPSGAALTKKYDGTPNVDVKSPIVVVDKDGGTITDQNGNLVDVNVTFTGATLVNTNHNPDSNVGTKTVCLTGVQLNVPNGKEGCYKLDTTITGGVLYVENAAEITKLPLKYKIVYPHNLSVKFGMDNPTPVLELENPDELKDAQSRTAYSSSDDHKAFWDEIGVDITRWESARKPYSPIGSYSMKPSINNNKECNYEIYNNDDSQAVFAVTRDSAAGKYSIPEEEEGKVVNYKGLEYYPSYTIIPKGTDGYTEVRIVTDGADLTPDMDRNTAEGQFHSSVSIEDETVIYDSEHPLQFQLLNPVTHAVSEIYTVEKTIRIDSKAPQYVSHTIEELGPVYQFGFGTYSSLNMRLKIVYSDTQSGCTKLHYYFADENGNAKEGMEVKKDMVSSTTVGDNGQPCYETYIPVEDDSYYGQIVLWTEDAMGHTSDKVRLVKDTSENPNGGYYEWMVENNGPVAEDMVVQGNGGTAYTGNWYNKLEASIVAKDDDSGLKEAEWTIVTPDNPGKTVITPVNGENATTNSKQKNNTFKYVVPGTESESYAPGAYSFSAIVKDNAGNTVEVAQKGPFLYDGTEPKLTVSDDAGNSNSFRQNVKVTMNVTEGENESGIDKIRLYKDAEGGELIQTWSVAADQNKSWSESYTIDKKGRYVIVVTDQAGNKTVKEVNYDKISAVKPETPVITITKGDQGEIGDSGWFIQDKPKVTIQSVAQTTDQVPVTTYYKVIYKDATGTHEAESHFETPDHTFSLDGQGEVTIEAWAKSESGCISATVSQMANVDIDAPLVAIKNSTADASGNVTVNFQVTDAVSGVDTEKVTVNDVKVSVKEKDGVITGSFKANGNKEYKIVAYDKAGNASKPVLYAPLQLKVTPVTAITKTSAHMDVQVIQGSNPIGTCYVEYKKQNQSGYDTLLVNQNKTEAGISMSCDFERLASDTVYDYRVYASTENGGEERVVTGSFRTLNGKSTATVYGNASYGSNVPDATREKAIYVNLYNGNVVISGQKVQNDGGYEFTGVPDGTYRIVATNGLMSQEKSVTVENGLITYPTDYATSGGINFVLSGLSTNVILDDGDVEITVDGLDKIYTDGYNGNVTEEDLEIVRDGGRIDITLHASYVTVNDISSVEQGILVDKLGVDARILRYINLYIEKEVYNKDGALVEEKQLSQLRTPLTISFPLGDLAGQSIRVAMLHASGNNFDFKNFSDTNEATLTHDYVVITTDHFSTYVLYKMETTKYYNVVWKDGDGNVMKSETVQEGNAATPPEQTPTKESSSKYSYTFAGWDQDYSNVTKDMVILAQFYAQEVDTPASTEQPTTEQPSTEQPANPSSDNQKPSSDNKPVTDNNDKTTTVTTNKQPVTKQPVTYTYIGSSNSPKTGDAAPITVLAVMMTIAGAGIVILLKKKNRVSKN